MSHTVIPDTAREWANDAMHEVFRGAVYDADEWLHQYEVKPPTPEEMPSDLWMATENALAEFLVWFNSEVNRRLAAK